MENETVKKIANETETVKRRSIGLAILFSIITFGIYYLYWFVKVTTDSNRIGDIKTANGFLSLVFVLITFGIYGYYWAYKLGKKAYAVTGGCGGGVYLLLYFFGLGFVDLILAQAAINSIANA